MVEALVVSTLFLGGAGLGTWLRPAAHPLTGLMLALPLGLGAYLLVGWVLLVLSLPFAPAPIIVVVLVAGVVVAISRRGDVESPGMLTAAGLALSVAVVFGASLVLQQVPLTRLTPDSIRYVAAAGVLVEYGDLAQMHPFDLVRRQIIEALAFTPAALTDDVYLPSLMPIFGLSGVGASIMLGDEWMRRRGLAVVARAGLGVAVLVFIFSTNRAVFNLTYIHGHMLFAVFLLVAVAGAWLAIATEDRSWGVLVAPALVLVVALRPEGLLVATTLLVPLVASSRAWAVLRWSAVGATAGAALLWFGVVALPRTWVGGFTHAHGGLVVAVALLVFAAGRHAPRLEPWYRFTPHLLVAVLLAGLPLALTVEPEVMRRTLVVTAENVTGQGAWNLTWVGLPLLVAAVLAMTRLPAHAIWWTPLLSFIPLVLLSSPLRGSYYRLGSGDSGNRMLMHILLVALAYLLACAAGDVAGRSRGRSREAVRSPPQTAGREREGLR